VGRAQHPHRRPSGRETFARANGLRAPHFALVRELADRDGDRRIDETEAAVRKVKYWDFHRQLADAAGRPVFQFLFVELDGNSKQFAFFRGAELDPHRVTV
jgi:DNA-binding GntR family transcriptional regulator